MYRGIFYSSVSLEKRVGSSSACAVYGVRPASNSLSVIESWEGFTAVGRIGKPSSLISMITVSAPYMRKLAYGFGCVYLLDQGALWHHNATIR